jgi:hypothetical protein
MLPVLPEAHMFRRALFTSAFTALLGIAAASPAAAVPVADGITFISEMVPNGQVDGGEGVAMSFCVRNPDPTPTPPLLGTLLEAGGVTSPSFQVSFGSLAPGETVCRSFSFRVTASCGAPAVATLSLKTLNPEADYSLAAFPLPVGASVFSQSFDLVTPPALPSGWTSTLAQGSGGWVTSAATPDTAPNTAFVPGSNSLDASLVSPPLIIPAAGSMVLTFRHFYNIESSWDGGVLEMSIAGAAFQDVIAAGGVFIAGGYNTASVFSGPLAGRPAWSGNSQGFISTQVQLPPTVANQSVRFRWRYGTDLSVSGVGWRVDSVAITATTCGTIPQTSPWGLQAAVRGNQVSFAWRAPLGATPTSYVLEVSTDGGNAFPLAFPVGAVPALTTTGPDAVFVTRIRAQLGGGTLGPPSGAVSVALGATSPPGTPRNLIATGNGSALNLAWSLDELGGRSAAVLLEAGTAPGLANITTLPLPPGSTSFAIGGVPAGTYFLRLRQRGPALDSAPSHELAVTMPGTCVVPAAPFYLTGEKSGTTVRLTWELSAVGTTAPTAWVLTAGTQPGLVNIGAVTVGQRQVTAPLPPGQYWIRAYAVNACGMSPGSNDLSFTIP